MRRIVAFAIVVAALWFPAEAEAIDWPWSKRTPPHELTAQCSLTPEEIQQGSTERLRAAVETNDTHEHSVEVVWSGNGGVLSGTGAEIEVDAQQVNPGVYSVMALAQDEVGVRASCIADFRVLPPVNELSMSCRPEQDVVEVGLPVRLLAEASDLIGQPLRYLWFTNGGEIEGEGAEVALNTTDVKPGVYTVTGRVEDGLGGASDCVLTVRLEPLPPPPPPPPPPPEPSNIAQIVFDRNQDRLSLSGASMLDRIVERLQAEPAARISVEGYADPNERDPQQLAAARVGTVLRYFLERGIAQSRVETVVGLGGRRTVESRNRTLDIIWLPEGVLY